MTNGEEAEAKEEKRKKVRKELGGEGATRKPTKIWAESVDLPMLRDAMEAEEREGGGGM